MRLLEPVAPRKALHRSDAAASQPWLAWAATQIEATLTIDGEARERILVTLLEVLTRLDCTPGDAAAEMQRERLITAMQAHDRLFQQLQHVAEAVRAVGAMTGTAGTSVEWDALRRRQLRAFSMHEERELFRRMVPAVHDEEAADGLDSNVDEPVEFFV